MDDPRLEKQKAQQAFDDGTPPPKRDALLDACSQFLNTVLPAKNVILDYEWRTFKPLFNSDEFNKLSPDQIDMLVNKYYMRFSMQHPIVIISNEYDDEGVFYPADGHRHKKLQELPPVFRSVLTINSLGGNATELVTMFMNTTRNQTPINDRTNLVKEAMIAAIKKANKGILDDEAAAKAYAEQVKAIEDTQIQPTKQVNEDTIAGFTDDMPWE